MSQQVEIQRLVDRAAIHDLHVRYFQGIDAADRDQVRSCFTADVRADYDRRRFVQGIDELMGVFQAFSKRASGEWKSTSHFMGNLIFRALADESAQTEVYAFACLVTPGTGPDLVTIRSLRYLEWSHEPPQGSCVYRVDYVLALREPDGEVRVVHDVHRCGLFPRELWLEACRAAGLEPELRRVELREPEAITQEVLLCRAV